MANSGKTTVSIVQSRLIADFLQKNGMHHDILNFDENVDRFLVEMEKGLKGTACSLPMIPTYISMSDLVPKNEPVIVIDAGGTNLRVCLVKFDEQGQAVISDFKNYPMPGTQGAIDRNTFFDMLASYLEPVLNKSTKIGFCFSYPVEIQPNRDGKLLFFTKEVKVSGVEGELLGRGLQEAINNRGYDKEYSIAVLNDTVAALLGGRAAYPNRVFDSYIGFILGTGTNTCYIEHAKNITKLPDSVQKDGNMLINVESGGYEGAPRGAFDLAFDETTVNPGRYALEKMMSGGYQGGLFHTVIAKCVEEGLFSEDFEAVFKGVTSLVSKDMDDFLNYPASEKNVLSRCCGIGSSEQITKDRCTLYHIIDVIIERAAKLAAINLTATVIKSGRGQNPLFPVCIAADGSAFYKSKLFRAKLDTFIATHMNKERGLYCEFVKAENANLVGSAIAGLT